MCVSARLVCYWSHSQWGWIHPCCFVCCFQCCQSNINRYISPPQGLRKTTNSAISGTKIDIFLRQKKFFFHEKKFFFFCFKMILKWFSSHFEGQKKIFDFLVVEKFVLRKMKKKIRKNTFFFNFFHFSQGKFLYHQKIWKFFWPSKSLKNHFKIILKQKKNFFLVEK